jgi:hypothetical protein
MRVVKKIVSYSVKIADEEIVVNGKTYAQTARVSFRDVTKNLVRRQKLAVVDVKELYEAIHRGEELDVSDCLVHNFSLHDYRDQYGLEQDSWVELKNFKAVGGLFEADKEVDFSFAHFVGEVANFDDAHFGAGNLSFSRAWFHTDKVVFKDTSYSEGFNSFQYTDFGSGVLTFENASFINGDLSFVNAQFNDGKVNFKNVDFGDGGVLFRFAEFGTGDVNFDRAVFNGPFVDFSKVNFGKGKVDFRRCRFGNTEVSFEEIELQDGRLLFRRAKFGERPVSFRMVQFPNASIVLDEVEFGKGRVSFFESHIKTISIKSSILSSYVDMRVNKCEVIDLSNAIIQNIIDFKKGVTPVEIGTLYLYGVRNLGKLFISWDGNNIPKIIGGQKKTSHNQKAEQFRLLKEEFHNLGQYEDEDKAYIEFKRSELANVLHETKKAKWYKKIVNYFSVGFQKLIFDWMGLYATSPVRVLFSIFMLYGMFSMLYVIFELTNHGAISCISADLSVWEKIVDSFYFSAVTWLTIGYGECVPTGFFKIVAPLEGWFGVFMMSYFTVAFVRKILR